MIEIVLAAGAVVSVLAFGGTSPLWFVLVQAAVAITALAAFWRHGFPPVSRPTRTLLVLLIAMPVFQIIPLPERLLAALSPERVALAASLGSLPIRMTPTLSVYTYETQGALLRLVCCVLVFLLAYHVTSVRGRATFMASVLLGLALFESAYGIVQYLTGWHYIFFFKKLHYVDEATGTYINRNHFAGMLEMGLPFLMARILLPSDSHGAKGRSRWVQLIASPLSSRFLRDVVLAAVILLALIFSKSRMGIAGGMAGIMVVGAIALFRDRRRRTWLSMVVILLVAGLYASWIGLDPVFSRFQVLEQAGALEQDRLPIWRDTIAVIRDYPWFGTGLGTFTWSSLHYQTHLLNLRYVHAHNDYLEFAADIGIPLALLLFAGLWTLVAKIAKKAVQFERTHQRVVAAGCAGALAALLIHGLADFNLQIPANAYLFSWIAGTAAALRRES